MSMLMAFGKTLDSSLRSPKILGVAAAIAAFLLDQAHKFWMLDVLGMAGRAPLRLAPFLDVVLSWNRGISYSMLSAQGDIARYGLLVLQLAIVAGLCVWLWRTSRRLTALALGLMVGGAIGNALDRLRFGAVADFFFLHTSLPVGPLANYVFNVADALITLGVALMLIDAFRNFFWGTLAGFVLTGLLPVVERSFGFVHAGGTRTGDKQVTAVLKKQRLQFGVNCVRGVDLAPVGRLRQLHR